MRREDDLTLAVKHVLHKVAVVDAAAAHILLAVAVREAALLQCERRRGSMLMATNEAASIVSLVSQPPSLSTQGAF